MNLSTPELLLGSGLCACPQFSAAILDRRVLAAQRLQPLAIGDREDPGRDLGVDFSYQAPLANGDVLSFNGRYIDERQALDASVPLGLAANRRNDLHDIRADVSYYWRNKVGVTVQAFDTTGSADPLLYASNRTFKPDSSGVTVQIDGTPFGGRPQPQRRINLRVGVQFTAYGRFNGARRNFDGAGSSAAGQNTLRVFTWLAF